MLKKTMLFVAAALPLSFTTLYAMNIEECFPNSFEKESGIKVHKKQLGGVEGYEIEEFQETEKNRNHWDSRGENPSIKSLVIHYTVCNFPQTLDLFTKNLESGRVSAHYVITEQDETRGIKGGIPVQVVPEDKRSWHAGVSSWRGTKNLNAESIGIMNVNPGFTGDETKRPEWYKFDPDQIDTLGRLSADIITKYKIPPSNVVGHADIAPTRHQNPGILFPWEKLYEKYGIGMWLGKEEQTPSFISSQYLPKEPLPHGTSEAFFLKTLQEIGYECPESSSITPEHFGVVKAFKSHFSHNQRPIDYTPSIDKEAMFWAWGIGAKYPQK